MPFAPSIKKKIVQALEEHIIPQLQTQTFIHIDGRPPFYWDGAPHKIIRHHLLPNSYQHPLNFRTEYEGGMTALRVARLVLRYNGISRECFGITQRQAALLRKAGLCIPAGIIECRVAAPAFYYIPPHIPHYGEPLIDEAGPGSFLSFEFNEKELFLHLRNNYVLHIPSPLFNHYLQQYLTLLQNRHTTGAQTVMTELVLQLKPYVKTHTFKASSAAWPALGNNTVSISLDTSQRNIRLCQDVNDYIQQHLHQPLLLEEIARQHRVSSVHLNRVFRATTGMTLIRYVTLCRIEAAKMILHHNNESITAIAQLVGFSSLCSFDTVFKRTVGTTPHRYRQQTGIRNPNKNKM